MNQKKKLALAMSIALLVGLWVTSAFQKIGIHFGRVTLFASSGMVGTITPAEHQHWEWLGLTIESNEVKSFDRWGFFAPLIETNPDDGFRYVWIPIWTVLLLLAISLVVFRAIHRSCGKRGARDLLKKQSVVALWSIAWASLMSTIEAYHGIQSHGEGLTWLLIYVIGFAYLARPIRTAGETLVLAAAGTLVFVPVRIAFQSWFDLIQLSAVQLWLSILVGSLVGWLILSAILLVAHWVARKLNTVPYLGNCLHCGYDLRSNESGCCPECGEAVPEDQQRYLRKLERKPSQPEGQN